MRLRPGRELSERGGYGINRQLRAMTANSWVWWSSNFNSYVAIQDERGAGVISINGIGEIRWIFRINEWMDDEGKAAFDYFFEKTNA
jgi:hypothetical protein